MQRYTISLEDKLAAQFDDWISRHGYQNRSEAVRDLLRDRLGKEALDDAPASSQCLACVSYVYDHHARELGRRLTNGQHRHHDLTVSTLHVHLDADQCFEVALLRGESGQVLMQAESLVAERGVRHGKVHVVPIAKAISAGHSHAPKHPRTAKAR
ncbi:MAG: ribbon-helix-helix, copG family protein [Hydrocarboniphaga sp.]|uniref:nickel-responsive transcriptional regulator NikR n=1 Tax=Hydrocarboniphaga sp. TaxID=2033016 RepID=UPI002610C8AA|nr:nickel-responsive transcriptional regulator NikR [Hydrocarboniphaga sp.]MDB5970417.1 ribbon-helix-helix, copG family protein [Hydrocarboniphaga sp.]